MKVVVKKEVQVLGHGPGQAVLHGYDRDLRIPIDHRPEELIERLAGDDPDLGAGENPGRGMAERPRDALDGRAYPGLPYSTAGTQK
jgi:hypothetical protein